MEWANQPAEDRHAGLGTLAIVGLVVAVLWSAVQCVALTMAFADYGYRRGFVVAAIAVTIPLVLALLALLTRSRPLAIATVGWFTAMALGQLVVAVAGWHGPFYWLSMATAPQLFMYYGTSFDFDLIAEPIVFTILIGLIAAGLVRRGGTHLAPGVAATERILAALPQTRIIVVTTYETDSDILRAVEAGAAGYLLKDATRTDLTDAIRDAARGRTVLAPAVAGRLARWIRRPAATALSAREIDVLTLVAKGHTNIEIGSDLHISEATVKTHLLRAFGKLGVSDRTAAVTTAMKLGVLPQA